MKPFTGYLFYSLLLESMSTVYVIFWELSCLVPDNNDEFQLQKIARIDSFVLLGQFYINIRSDDGVFLSQD